MNMIDMRDGWQILVYGTDKIRFLIHFVKMNGFSVLTSHKIVFFYVASFCCCLSAWNFCARWDMLGWEEFIPENDKILFLWFSVRNKA